MARVIDSDAKNMIGDNVRALRLERGMSQRELSEKLETYGIYVCRGSISRIEEKQRTVTDIELFGLSRIFDVDINSLYNKKQYSDYL